MNLLKTGLSFFSETLHAGWNMVVPAALGIAVQAGISDPRIGKIVGGVGLVISGWWVTAFSVFSSSNRKRSFKWMAPLGFGVTCYGVYNIARGIYELSNPMFNFMDPNHPMFKFYMDPNYINNARLELAQWQKPSNACNERLQQTKSNFLACPAAQELWNEVEGQGAFKVRCASLSELSLYHTQKAMTLTDKRQILIPETENNMLQPLLFELNNLKQREDQALIESDRCKLGADGFANAIEGVEYRTAKAAYEISDHCVRDQVWPEKERSYSKEFSGKFPDEDWTTFDGYLRTQEEGGHADLYRMHWYERCDPESLPAWKEKNRAKWISLLEKAEKKGRTNPSST